MGRDQLSTKEPESNKKGARTVTQGTEGETETGKTKVHDNQGSKQNQHMATETKNCDVYE